MGLCLTALACMSNHPPTPLAPRRRVQGVLTHTPPPPPSGPPPDVQVNQLLRNQYLLTVRRARGPALRVSPRRVCRALPAPAITNAPRAALRDSV